MSNEEPTAKPGAKFDLTERTAVFGEAVFRFLKQIPRSDVASPLVRQLVRSATSIGANYVEADEAGSKKIFGHRISICKRERKETMYWLRMIAAEVPEHAPQARTLERVERVKQDIRKHPPQIIIKITPWSFFIGIWSFDIQTPLATNHRI